MSDTSNSGGVGIFTTLTIIFIVLKFIGVIDWSWWWVFSPILISLILGLIVLAIISIISLLIN